MSKSTNYILSYASQVLFETVVDGKQGIGIIENGESIFIEGTLKQLIEQNEIYYVTNLAAAKRIAKDILGSSYGAPYIFMDMVWIPLETNNRRVTIYVALHHIEKISAIAKAETKLQLTHGVTIKLMQSKSKVYSRLFVACLLKLLIDLKKKYMYERGKQQSKRCEIIKERGNVYYTEK